MSIKVVIPSGKDTISVTGLYQWDYGQTLEIESLDIGSEVMEVHFACANMNEAIVHPCSFLNGVGKVTIPDQCLEQTSPITAWLYRISGTEGHTIKSITLPINARTRPSINKEIPPEFSDKYTELITEVNNAVNRLNLGEVTVERAKNAEYAVKAGGAATALSATRATNDSNGNSIVGTYGKFPATLNQLSYGDNLPGWGWYYIQAYNKVGGSLATTIGGIIHLDGTNEPAAIVNVTAISKDNQETVLQFDKLTVSSMGSPRVTMIYSDYDLSGMDITENVQIEYIRIL